MKKRLLIFTIVLYAVFSPSAVRASERGEPSAEIEPATEAGATVKTVAGTGGHGIQDGGALARFNLPAALTGSGENLYIADTYNNLIRSSDFGGVTETVAGQVLAMDEYRFPKGGHQDGAAGNALFNRPSGIVYSPAGRIFVADTGNHAIRAVDSARVSTYSGGGAGYLNGHVNVAKFNSPTAIAMDAQNNLYIADTLNHVIRKIDTDGNVSTVAGIPETPGYSDGAVGGALFNAPMGIAVSADGARIFVADTGNHRIRLISGGTVTTYAGTTELTDMDGEPLGEFLDGTNSAAKFNLPMGLALYNGDLIVADSGNNRIRLVTSKEVTTLAGSGEPGAVNGKPLEASFHLPSGVYVQEDTLYIADTGNNLIRSLSLDYLR